MMINTAICNISDYLYFISNIGNISGPLNIRMTYSMNREYKGNGKRE